MKKVCLHWEKGKILGLLQRKGERSGDQGSKQDFVLAPSESPIRTGLKCIRNEHNFTAVSFEQTAVQAISSFLFSNCSPERRLSQILSHLK